MPTIRLPYNNWRPREDQLALWTYLERGGKRAVEIAHRRWGKDDVALHNSACRMHERVGTYWHMLPQANQARKAIWDAINPRTGKRRIDEAFPKELRETTREVDMMIKLKVGSTWQVIGSDSYDAAVGAPPIGITFSEWALSQPQAWAYLRPIVDENNGWAVFITTPRGRNHAFKTYELGRTSPNWFAEIQRADQTPVFSLDHLAEIKAEYIKEYGEDDGEALFNQEYMCSFDSQLIGSYYAKLIAKAEANNRIRDDLVHDPAFPVQTAFDIGVSDDTAIWFFQVIAGVPCVFDYYEASGYGIDHYAEVLEKKKAQHGWTYFKQDPNNALHWVPWDARPRNWATTGAKSILEIAWSDFGLRFRVTPNLSVQDGIQATRRFLGTAFFHSRCAPGIEHLRNYRRTWDDVRKVFSVHPLHDEASHGADACRYMAIVCKDQIAERPKKEQPKHKYTAEKTMDELFAEAKRARGAGRRF